MDAYPPPYVEHNLPLVLLSGLGEEPAKDGAVTGPKRQESGARIFTESPECQSSVLLRAFKSFDGSDYPWNATALPGPTGALRYCIRTIGRSYVLPPRKAAPLPQSPGAEGPTSARNSELHSPLSPLSPGSPVFPDGILTPSWFVKHQDQVPALLLAVFSFNAGEAASQDELIKNDINAIRGALTRSGFKTRLTAILVSDQSILQATDLEERLSNIRRATGLDSKTGLFLMPPMASLAETATFVQSILTTLQPSCVEYYRELTKHARRKKARGGPAASSVSPLVSASQSTSTSGWNVRYEVKQGVFAEYRQEMDVAERHYSAAIEELLSPEGGVFETTVNWSPRWDEARLLCDALAIRVLRCLLWTGTTTGVVQSWQNYRLRMKALVDQRGKGSLTYGWAAWEGRWAGILSELIEASGTTGLQRPVEKPDQSLVDIPLRAVFVLPEKPPGPADRVPPFHLLHHPGYWLRFLANGIRLRWQRALTIPEEDRVPPGQSPASAVVHRAKNYDSYLVLEPHAEVSRSGGLGYDYAVELSKVSARAADEFDARDQFRLGEQTRLELALDLVRAELFNQAIEVLQKLWHTSHWRQDDWHGPFGEILRSLLRCLKHDKRTKYAELIPQATWELLSISTSHGQEGDDLDFMNCLESWDDKDELELQLHDDDRLSPISVAFAFSVGESFVGEIVECQVTLAYSASQRAQSLEFREIELSLGAQVVHILHTPSEGDNGFEIATTSLTELDDGVLQTNGDLRFAPSQRRAFIFALPLRESEILSIASVNLKLKAPYFSFKYTITETSIKPAQHWWLKKNGHPESTLLSHLDARSLNVLPKPPKMEIRIHDLQHQYYVDEKIRVTIELINLENESVSASVVPKIVGIAGETVSSRWEDAQENDLVRSIGVMPSGMSQKAGLLIEGPAEGAAFTLSIDVRYTLTSDTSTPLVKSQATELSFTAPLEAKYTFGALLHPAPWPSFFDPTAQGTETHPDGILQLWRLGSRITSLADQSIKIQQTEIIIQEVEGDAVCQRIPDATMGEERILAAGEKLPASFELTTQKFSLDDRRPAYLILALSILWSREGAVAPARTVLPIPRLTIPASEPRVLCTVAEQAPAHADLTLYYTLENPSAHFLTFALTMEASDEFAFSGPKYRALSLAPLSRHRLVYHIVLHETIGDEGLWISPALQVVDSYYHKNLRVHPGGDRVKLGEKREVKVFVEP